MVFNTLCRFFEKYCTTNICSAYDSHFGSLKLLSKANISTVIKDGGKMQLMVIPNEDFTDFEILRDKWVRSNGWDFVHDVPFLFLPFLFSFSFLFLFLFFLFLFTFWFFLFFLFLLCSFSFIYFGWIFSESSSYKKSLQYILFT